MRAIAVAPVVFGCCPGTPRCVLCAPAPALPSPDTVAALLAATRRDRADPVTVGFFGGPPPSDDLLDAIGDAPFTVRVRPDLLEPKRARALADRGCVGIEVDALSFDDQALKACRRPYRAPRVLRMLDALAALPLRLGLVLAPGLPHASSTSAIRDAHIAAPLVRAVRIHPVLVFRGSQLHDNHAAGLFEPMTLNEAVATCRAMVDVFDAAGVEVVRIGVQSLSDGLGEAVAGPRHPSLRELVEAHRALDHLTTHIRDDHRGRSVVVFCAPCDETRARGPLNCNVRDLRARHGLTDLRIVPDPDLTRGLFRVEVA